MADDLPGGQPVLTFYTKPGDDFVPGIEQDGTIVSISPFSCGEHEVSKFFFVSGVPKETITVYQDSSWFTVDGGSVYEDANNPNERCLRITVKPNAGLERTGLFTVVGDGTMSYLVQVSQFAYTNFKLSGMTVLNATCTSGGCNIDKYHYSCNRKALIVLPELPERGEEGTTYFIGSHTMDEGFTEYVWSNASGWVAMGTAAASLVAPATTEKMGLAKIGTDAVIIGGADVGMNGSLQLKVPMATHETAGAVKLGSMFEGKNAEPYRVGITADNNSQLVFNLKEGGSLKYERSGDKWELRVVDAADGQKGVVGLTSSLAGLTDSEIEARRNTHAASVGLVLDGLESYVRGFVTDARISSYFEDWASGKDIPSSVWEAHQLDILQSLDDAIFASDTLSELVASNVRIYMDERFTDEYLLSLVLDDLQKISRNYWTNDIDEAIAEEAKKEVAIQFPEQLTGFLSKQENVNAIASVVKEEVKDILNEDKDDIVAGYIREIVEGDIEITIDGEETTFPAVVKKEVSNYSTIPAGTVIMHAGIKDVDGFVDCDGRSLDRAKYPALFDAIGTTYGSTSSSTFNVPNFNGRFAQGAGTPGQVKEAGLPNITGKLTRSAYIDSASGALSVSNNGWNGGREDWAACVDVSLDASRSSSIYGKSDTVQPPALTMRFLIKF